MATDLYYHSSSSHTFHKAGLLLVHVAWQEGWAGVSSPCLTFPAELTSVYRILTQDSPHVFWQEFDGAQALQREWGQGCWASVGSTCPSLVRGSQDSSCEDKDIMLFSAVLTAFLRKHKLQYL